MMEIWAIGSEILIREGRRKSIKEDSSQVLVWGIGWMVTIYIEAGNTVWGAGFRNGKGKKGKLPGFDCL